MPSLSQAKTLGGVGGILILLTLIPAAGFLLAIAGFVLTLLAVKYISDSLQDRSIFNNMIIAVILAIVGVVVGAIVVFASVFRFVGLGFLQGGFISPGFNPSTINPGDYIGLFIGVIAGLAIVWVILIISAIFLRRSYSSIANKLNVNMFNTAALLFLIGAALTIVLVGFLIIFIAIILQIVSFFSITEVASQPQQAPTSGT